MKKYLISESGNFYKANLHCHSVYSDGKLSVEALKSLYKNAGYSVLAITDHNVLFDHSYLNDENFLTLTSVEIDVKETGSDRKNCFHLNFYSKDPHNTAIPCFNPSYLRHQNKPDVVYPEQKYVGTPDYVRDYKNINAMISEFVKNGFLACLNHVTWSIQDLDDYRDIDGIFAMEIYNHACVVEGYDEINSRPYDELLRRGRRIFCIAADDNHNKYPPESPRFSSLGGFVMIKSPSLNYKDIIESLENGDFYSSNGPQIYELYREDDHVNIKTSPSAKITISGYARSVVSAFPENKGDTITEAVLPIKDSKYFRITVDDGYGHFAWTNAYFVD